MGFQDIDFAIITAPRAVPTLDYSIKSLREYADVYLTIFSEPGHIEVEGNKMDILVNREKLGALKNYNQAVNWLLKFGKKPFLCVLEDDYIYNPSIVDRMNEVTLHQGDFGYYNLFTNSNNPLLKKMGKGWVNMNLGYYDAWGVAYVFQRHIAERILMQEFYIEAFEKTDRNIDAVVSETLKRMGLPMFYHNPSPTCSFGVVSTLGHNCETDGLNFSL